MGSLSAVAVGLMFLAGVCWVLQHVISAAGVL